MTAAILLCPEWHRQRWLLSTPIADMSRKDASANNELTAFHMIFDQQMPMFRETNQTCCSKPSACSDFSRIHLPIRPIYHILRVDLRISGSYKRALTSNTTLKAASERERISIQALYHLNAAYQAPNALVAHINSTHIQTSLNDSRLAVRNVSPESWDSVRFNSQQSSKRSGNTFPIIRPLLCRAICLYIWNTDIMQRRNLPSSSSYKTDSTAPPATVTGASIPGAVPPQSNAAAMQDPLPFERPEEQPPSYSSLPHQDGAQEDMDFNRLSRKSQWITLAIASGACAAFNGVFAKL